MEKEFKCAHNCPAVVKIENGPHSTTLCPYCGAKYHWELYGSSWGGWGNGPYYDRGPRPEKFVLDDLVVISYAGSHFGEDDCESRAVVIETHTTNCGRL